MPRASQGPLAAREAARTHRKVWDAQAFMAETFGLVAMLERAFYIRSLPIVQWRGQVLRTIRCHGTTGKGPHDYNVPELVLWALVDPEHRFLCPFHR